MPASSNPLKRSLWKASQETNVCLACRSRQPLSSLRLVGSGSVVTQDRSFSVFNRPPPNYPGHVPLTHLERLGLTVGSAFGAYIDPNRHDLVASLGEATAQPAVRRLRDAMLRDPTGRRILRERPRITSSMLSPQKLSSLPPNSVGATYAAWLDREHVSADTRATVRYVDDEECAYVIQRYRESHDFYHALTGLPVFREGEVALKAWEFAALGLPMTGLSVFSLTSLPKKARDRFWSTYGPWAVRNGEEVGAKVLCVYWEEILDMDCDVLREKLGVVPPPDLREVRRRAKEERKREKEAKDAMQTLQKAGS